MSLINNIIPEQNFEKVRDIIGIILKDELENQKVLQPTRFTEDINVFTARTTPFQQSEILMINISCDNANYTSRTQANNQGGVNYNIDIFSSAKETSINGGLNSARIRDKYNGAVRYILSSTKYNTLSLPLGIIMGTTINGFENFEVPNSLDTSFNQMCRITFNVRMTEDQALWEGVSVNGLNTTVKIDLTDNGYQLIKDF